MSIKEWRRDVIPLLLIILFGLVALVGMVKDMVASNRAMGKDEAYQCCSSTNCLKQHHHSMSMSKEDK